MSQQLSREVKLTYLHSWQTLVQMPTSDHPPWSLPNLPEPAPPEREPVMDCGQVLTTLSGVTFNVSLDIAQFDRFVMDDWPQSVRV